MNGAVGWLLAAVLWLCASCDGAKRRSGGGFTGWLRHEWRVRRDVQEWRELWGRTEHRRRKRFLRCPIELHGLVQRYFAPHGGGVTAAMIRDAVNPNMQRSKLRGIVLVQVIGAQIFVDSSMSVPLPQWERLRLAFILGRLKEFIAQRSSYCDAADHSVCSGDFEFVADLKDCQSGWNAGSEDLIRYGGMSDAESMAHYASLPIMTVTKCQGRDSIPLAQWHEERDGPFDAWDAYRYEFLARIQQSPYWTRVNKAVFRGAFRRYSSHNTEGRLEPTLIDDTNWRRLGRSRLQHLAWTRPDLLDVGISMDRSHRKIFDGYVNRLPWKVYMSSAEQATTFKYVVYAEGWCGWADRLKVLLMFNSTIFLQQTPCHEYYQDLMVPYEHFVPVDGLFEELPGKIEWARRNPDDAERIAANALNLGQRYLSRDAIGCYMDLVFAKYSTLVQYRPVKTATASLWTAGTFGKSAVDAAERTEPCKIPMDYVSPPRDKDL